jgi:hypothetical protein
VPTLAPGAADVSGAASEALDALGAPSGPQSKPALRRFKPYPAYKDSGVEWLGEMADKGVIVAYVLVDRLLDRGAAAFRCGVLLDRCGFAW